MKDWIGSKASVFSTLGASNHSDRERQPEDYYATDPVATEWLCRLEHFDGPILEPSCGEGHISRVLIDHGYDVESRDLIDRGYGTGVCDFLAIDNQVWNGDIVTDPPYKEQSLRHHRQFSHLLRLVHLGQRLSRKHLSPMVQLVQIRFS